MDQPDRIHLRDHVISAEIGAFQAERGQPQRLRLGIEVDLAAPVSGAGDEVDRILSYDILTRAVRDTLAERRYDLLESLAEAIAARILAEPGAAEVRLTIEKLDRVPGALGISIARRRPRLAVAPPSPAPLRVLLADPAAPPARLPEGGAVLVPSRPARADLPAPAMAADQPRIAALALDQAAWAMAGGLGLTVADSRTEIDWARAEGHAVVWAPARMIRDAAPDDRPPPQPEALARWLAGMLGATLAEGALPGDRS